MKLKGYEFNFWVIAGMVVLAITLGVLNNFRVYEEQQVPWFGATSEE